MCWWALPLLRCTKFAFGSGQLLVDTSFKITSISWQIQVLLPVVNRASIFVQLDVVNVFDYQVVFIG